MDSIELKYTKLHTILQLQKILSLGRLSISELNTELINVIMILFKD